MKVVKFEFKRCVDGDIFIPWLKTEKIIVQYENDEEYTHLHANIDLYWGQEYNAMLNLGWLDKDMDDRDRIGQLLAKM